MAFCPSCGKKTKEGFCIECMPKKEIQVKDISVKVCAKCNKFFYRNKWANFETIENALIKFAKDKIDDKNIKLLPKLPKFHRAPGTKVMFNYMASSKDGSFEIPARMHINFCDKCSQEENKYYEGTLQLRNVNDEILDFAEKYVTENKIHIAKKTVLNNGYDLDISDQRKLQNLCHLLEKNFGGKATISIRQFTQDRLTSKQVYRINALYIGPQCKKGDVIKKGHNIYLITNVRKDVSAYDIKHNKKTTISLDDGEVTILPVLKTTVSKVYPNIEVFDPEIYQSVPIQNEAEVKIGEKVKIVNDNGAYYLVYSI